MDIKNNKFVIYLCRILGFALLIAGLYLSLNLAKTWISWGHDRAKYHEVTAIRENLTVIYNYKAKEYVVDTITGNSYKQIDLNQIFKEQKKVTLYCDNSDYHSCLYLDYNYTNPIRTIIIGIILAVLGGFLAFPNRFVNGFLYTKEKVKKTVHKRKTAKKK